MTALDRALRYPARLADAVIGGLLLVIVAITLAATGNRYLLGGALPFAEELNMLLWVWMIQLAALRAVHIRVDFVVARFPPAARRWFGLASAVISIACLVVLMRSAIGMVQFTSSDFYVSMPGLSEKWAYVPVAIVAPLWILRILRQTATTHLAPGLT